MAKMFKQDPEIVSVNCDVTNWVIYTFLDLNENNIIFWRMGIGIPTNEEVKPVQI